MLIIQNVRNRLYLTPESPLGNRHWSIDIADAERFVAHDAWQHVMMAAIKIEAVATPEPIKPTKRDTFEGMQIVADGWCQSLILSFKEGHHYSVSLKPGGDTNADVADLLHTIADKIS